MPEVLVVDDSEGTRLLLEMAFVDAGFTVREAADGIEALTELVQRAPDVMVLDLVMPHLGGFAVLTAMREQGLAPGTRVLLHSDDDTAGHRACADALGAEDFILKPTDPFTVVDRVQAVLALAGTTRLGRGVNPAEMRPPAEVLSLPPGAEASSLTSLTSLASLTRSGVPGGHVRMAEVIELRAYAAGSAS